MSDDTEGTRPTYSTLVYIREDEDPGREAPWVIYGAVSCSTLWRCWTRRDAIDYCNDEGWDVRDGPVMFEADDDWHAGDEYDQ